MIALLAELFLDGRLATCPERARFLVKTFARRRGACRSAELWTPWNLPETERVGGLRVRTISADRLQRLLEPGLSGIVLLGDSSWNRAALESGRVEEIWIRWLPGFGCVDLHSFVSGFRPPEGARLPLRLMRWRRGGDGIVARYEAVKR